MRKLVVAQYENQKNFSGSIRSGVHVLQLELSAWNHPGESALFAESWRKFGALVTALVSGVSPNNEPCDYPSTVHYGENAACWYYAVAPAPSLQND